MFEAPLLISLSLTLNLQAETKANAERPSAEIIRADDFATRRFQEVIESYQKNQPKSLQEELISLRAHLVIAERKWSELQQTQAPSGSPNEKQETNRPQMLRAAQAKVNHLQASIARLEQQILKEKRKEQELQKKARRKRLP